MDTPTGQRLVLQSRVAVTALLAASALGLGVYGPSVVAPGAPTAPAEANRAAAGVAPSESVATTVPPTTVATGLKWTDGSPVRAAVVTERGAGMISRSSLKYRTLALTKGAQLVGVLADGRAVVFEDGKLHVVERGGTKRPYATGSLPQHDVSSAQVQVRGNTVYVMDPLPEPDAHGETTWVLTAYTGTGRPVTGRTVFVGEFPAADSWLVSKGRVYYSHTVLSSKHEVVRMDVRSRALGGNQVKTEARNASAPVLLDGGVAVTTSVPDAKSAHGIRPTGARLLGGRTLISSARGAWDYRAGGDGALASFTGGGRVLALNASLQDGTGGRQARYLVIDYKAEKAWSIASAGPVLSSPQASSSRVTWGSVKRGTLGDLGIKLYSFDVRTGQLRIAITKNDLSGGVATGRAIAWSTLTGEHSSVAAGLLH